MGTARRVFISHTSDLRRLPASGRSFVDAAETAVKRCAHAPVDMAYFTASPRPPERVCREAVASSDVVVALLGPCWGSAVPGRDDVSYSEFELDIASRRGIPRLAFIIDPRAEELSEYPCSAHERQKQEAFRRRVVGASDLLIPTVQTPEELTTLLLQALQSAVGDPGGGRAGECWSIPARHRRFTGRTAALDRLGARLGEGRSVVIRSIEGMGGVGKSALAIEFAHRHAAEWDVAWWVPAEDVTLIPGRLASLAHQMGVADPSDPHEVAVDRLRAALYTRERWLIVFDNAEDPATLHDHIPSGPGHVVITSRSPGWVDIASPIELDVLDADESVELVTRIAGRLTSADAARIAEALGHLPLALTQAAAFLEAGPMSVDEYLDSVRHRTAEILRRGRHTGYPASFAASWELAFDRLRAKEPAALQLMSVCAYLAPEPIPFSMLTEHTHVLTDSLAVAVRDPLRFADIVGYLRAGALARVESDSLQLHRLVQALLRELDSVPEIGPGP